MGGFKIWGFGQASILSHAGEYGAVSLAFLACPTGVGSQVALQWGAYSTFDV
jgi:hypothetical protein